MSYERDMSNEEIMITRLDTLIELTQESLDVIQMILENQNETVLKEIDFCNRTTCNHYINHHKLFGGCQVSECECEQFDRKEDKTKSDYPSGLDKSKHLMIQQEGLSGATEDLLKHIRAGNQHGANESVYCALIRLIQIVDNLGKRFFNA